MTAPAPSLIGRLGAFLRRLRADRQGNILMITGGAIILLAFAVGFGIDYSRAERLQTKLDAAADAASLAGVDPAMLKITDDNIVTQAAQAMFDQQVAGLPGLTSVNRTVTVTDAAASSLGVMRTVTVSYTAQSTNSFSGLLAFTKVPSAASLSISGTATASASQPPSMNFYMALDTSPSMLLPTTTTGIANLTAGAIWNGETAYYGRVDGCDFACHSSNMQQWNSGIYVIDASKNAIYLDASSNIYRVSCSGTVYQGSTVIGGSGTITTSSSGTSTSASYCSGSSPASNPVYIRYLPTGQTNKSSNFKWIQVNFPDTYWLAENYASVNSGGATITLRTDAETDAANGVVQYAYNIEQEYANAPVPPKYKMQFFTFNAANTAAAVSPQPCPSTTTSFYSFGCMNDVSLLQSQTFPSLTPISVNASISNPDTSFTSLLTAAQSTLPNTAGTGTQASPQNVLVIITDGAVDDTTGMSYLTTANIAQCTTIKKYARIAILYTQYLPATINYTADTTFNTFATGQVPSIQTALQSCASQNADGTYLMQTVSTDGSVSSALDTLFAMAVQSARLVQ